MALSRRIALLAVLAPLALAWLARADAADAASPSHIRHFFVIVLENENAGETFGAIPPAPYLGRTLKAAGAYMPNYHGTGHHSLDNYISMVSGQPPNEVSQGDCPVYLEMMPGSLGSDGVARGQGCVYPGSVQTIVDQLEEKGLGWRGYMQDQASAVFEGVPGTCRHPEIGAHDNAFVATATDQYATRHNPFVYFHSIIDHPTCDENDVDLSQLPRDLRRERTTPAYSFITPDLCADGHDATCPDPSQPGGFAGVEAFLREWVPRIQASPAYDSRSAILITFDESANGAESCCGERSGPNTANNGDGVAVGEGGGRVGAVMLSPCVRPGTVARRAYNHYSMLRWVEDDFGRKHLAEAARTGVTPFGSDVFTRPGCRLKTSLTARPSRAVAGRSTAFRFRFKTELPRCRQGARIHFGKRYARTDGRGIARITTRIGSPGIHYAAASSPHCNAARAPVRIVKRR